ncbi:hypothetical protein [Archangium sp.]|uniref:hypothetical protein n=1 Tax=Archangium sp. TaxID=1872627 RepID=UPI002ED85A20
MDSRFSGAADFRGRILELDLLQGIQVLLARILPEELQCLDALLGLRIVTGRGESLLKSAGDLVLAEFRRSVVLGCPRCGLEREARGRRARCHELVATKLRASGPAGPLASQGRADDNLRWRLLLVDTWQP